MTKLFFRLNLTREYDALSNHAEEYYGIGMDAHILATFRNSVSLFLQTLDKPYFLDPVFYRFSFPFYRNFAEKRWADTLREEYGIGGLLQEYEDGILYENLTGQQIANITSNVLSYQRRSGSESIEETSSLLELAGLDVDEDTMVPDFLIPPYFIYNDEGKPLATNLKFLDQAIRIKEENEKLYAQIVLDPDLLLDTEFLDKLIDSYSSKNIDGYTVWISDLKEFEVDRTMLEYFAKFLKKLKEASPTREVIDLYGGYYSLILTTQEVLDGVLQGVGISESKNPNQVGGGGRPRYYIPIARQMVSTDLASDLVRVNRLTFSCRTANCSVSQNITRGSVKELDEHFMHSRIKELNDLETSELSDVREILETDRNKLRSVMQPTAKGFAARTERKLSVWEEALDSIE